ncbi:hypothetical protein [Variovorax sp. PAMC26660]|uniref:hypothetical protein n=1 Tax=Variovorax sp. PAMC26660 TaxID=2762322 RepID=UPI00164E2687|nr:hypothetical protein [Variovorax sp. PAMC26660]QNK71129.1 hypothetical protein H7F35_16225 [Variovorax sp. PAMC26660]
MPIPDSANPSTSFDRISAGMLISGLVLQLIAKAVEPSLWSQLLYSVALLCWFSLPLWYPYSAVKAGVIGAGYRVFRQQEPFKFWAGLATYEVLLLVLGSIFALPAYAGFMRG